MSDTPRTDAARLCHFDEPVVPLDFARQLERELAEMQRENLVRQRSEMDLCQERDAWRACAERLAKVLAANKRHTEGYHGHLCVIGTSEALAAFEKLKGNL